jgi:hypothetical protein
MKGRKVMVTLNKVFLIEGNVAIYHAYKETRRSLVYHYSIDPDQCRTFDVRDLPGSERLDSLGAMAGQIRTATRVGLITQDELHI